VANLADHLFRQGRERPGKRALVFGEQSWTYEEIVAIVRRLAGGLRAEGIGKGTRVGIMVGACPQFIFFQQALHALGAIVTPLNIFYRRSELAHAASIGDLEILVMAGEYLDRLPQLDAADMATVRRVFVVDPTGGLVPGLIDTVDGLEAQGTALAEPVDLEAGDVVMMLNTSATTGKAKSVMLTLANIRANYEPTSGWLGLNGDTVTLCALPLYNTFGLNQGIMALMVTGATMVLMPRFDAKQCLEAIDLHRCTFFPAVPTMLQKVFDHPDARNYDLTSISRIMTGAAPVPAALLERIYAVMGPDTTVMSGYGLTEGTAIVTLEHIELDADGRVARPKSIGKVLPGMEMRMLTEDGRIAARGEVGEICVQGPNVMLGYYKQPEETSLAIRDGWLHTGDLGVVDDAGHAYIVDRKKDLIIRGGQNIYPADIEEVIYAHPGVREVAVVGIPDDVLGEIPVAYVAMAPGETASVEDLVARCREELAYYKVPAQIHFMDELPKGPTGKILRRGLRPT